METSYEAIFREFNKIIEVVSRKILTSVNFYVKSKKTHVKFDVFYVS